MTHNNSHSFVNIEINGEVCQIDLEILEIVNWFNSFDSVTTKFSCQGEENSENITRLMPYVSFRCDSLDDFEFISEFVSKFKDEFPLSGYDYGMGDEDMRIEKSRSHSSSYVLYFSNIKHKNLFTKYLSTTMKTI